MSETWFNYNGNYLEDLRNKPTEYMNVKKMYERLLTLYNEYNDEENLELKELRAELYTETKEYFWKMINIVPNDNESKVLLNCLNFESNFQKFINEINLLK